MEKFVTDCTRCQRGHKVVIGTPEEHMEWLEDKFKE
jgi:hypothetical protein